jgi:diguanylate cyclase (GGDEF)-like protein
MTKKISEREYSKMLQRLLEESRFDGALLTGTLEELESRYHENVFPDTLYHLTRMHFGKEESRSHFLNIIDRHREMSRVLGRKVGLRTAVCDYFLSQEQVFKDPVVIETRLLLQSEESALLDELTGLHNRRFLNMQLSKEAERNRRSGSEFSLLIIDVDYFKRYNDTYGHLAGDAALKQVASILKNTARHMDHVCRYGGEEFVVILPQTDKQKAALAAERHRMAVEKHRFEYGPLTISLGVASFPDDADHEADLLFRADFALYQAKNKGRNQVCAQADDKRSTVRYDMNLPVECRRVGDAGNGFNGRTVNVSLGGMLYEVGSPMEIGLKLEATLKDPENEKILPVKAVSLRKGADSENGSYLVGVEFDQESASREELRSLINSRLGIKSK